VDAYVFEAELVEYAEVSRRLAVRGDQTLEDLHEELRRAFEWWEDDEYSFQLATDVQLHRVELKAGQELAYVIGTGDEWRVRLRIDDIRPARNETYPVILESRGKAPRSIRSPTRRSSARATSRNWDTDTARRYHEGTKHSYESVRRRARPLDWANQPSPYKESPGVELEPIPPELERMLRLGAGVVRQRRGYDFRTYSSAGALYPIEVYVATADGLFHFHPRDLGLRRLRDEDVRGALGGGEVVLALTGILWRTAWKYGARGYRHLFWDAGTMLANLLELTDHEARVITGFVDDVVNDVLGVDGIDETALALLQLR